MKKRIKIDFTDFWFGNDEERLRNYYLFKLLDNNFNLELTDNPDFLIYSNFGLEHLKYNCIRIFYTGENKRPDFRKCDFAFSFDFPITSKNYRLPLYRTRKNYELLNNQRGDSDEILGLKTKFCNFIYSNKNASERINFFNKLSKYKKVDSGGKVLNNLGYSVKDKLQFMKNYKFSIAFENSSYPGYTTEKIADSLVAGTVPIYWGNPEIYKDFNPGAFINCHDYKNFDEVVERVIEVDSDENLYRNYLNEPLFPPDEDIEYLKEENILNRFDKIFSDEKIKPVARRSDFLKYYYFKKRRKLRRYRSEFLKSLLNFMP